jgi:cytochrome c
MVLLPVIAGGTIALGATACRNARAEVSAVPGGHPERGEQAFVNYGCGSCHAIDGWGKPKGHVGPPLSGVGERSIIAGELPNTPENMIRWIENPQAIEPNTKMPNLGVSPTGARDLVAYLYSLR